MQYNDKWLGMVGGGMGASFIAGMSVYQINMWNMAGGEVPMPVIIVCKRLGVVATAGMAHAVCLITGVTSPNEFTEIKSKGVDWALSVGADVDSVVKGLGGVADLIKSAGSKAGNWATQESAKKAVQGVMGDFTPTTTQPNFVLLPTPLALEVGAGVFYEWQTLTKTGTDVAWRYVQPSWWLEKKNGKVLLQMNAIPERDGALIGLQFRLKTWGTDDVLIFRTNRMEMVGFRQTNMLKTVRGTVRGGALYGENSQTPGLDLSALIPAGKLEVGLLSTDNKAKTFTNEGLQIGLSVTRDPRSETNLYKWVSKDYVRIRTGVGGQFETTDDTMPHS